MSASVNEPQAVPSRLPDPSRLFPDLAELAGAMFKIVHSGAVPAATVGFVQLRAGQVVGSTYHVIRQTGELRKLGESEDRITAVATWPDAPTFTEAERAALALVEAVLTPAHGVERVPDDLFAAAAAVYDEVALWTLTMAIAQICFFVPVALIAKPTPGREPHYRP